MLWCQGSADLGDVAYYDGFIIPDDSENVLSICIINTTAFFLLDMFQSEDHHEGHTSHIALAFANFVF
jgi:hypothetical protein